MCILPCHGKYTLLDNSILKCNEYALNKLGFPYVWFQLLSPLASPLFPIFPAYYMGFLHLSFSHRSVLDENGAFLSTADSAVKLSTDSTRSVLGWKGVEYRVAFPIVKPAGANFYPADMDKKVRVNVSFFVPIFVILSILEYSYTIVNHKLLLSALTIIATSPELCCSFICTHVVCCNFTD